MFGEQMGGLNQETRCFVSNYNSPVRIRRMATSQKDAWSP